MYRNAKKIAIVKTSFFDFFLGIPLFHNFDQESRSGNKSSAGLVSETFQPLCLWEWWKSRSWWWRKTTRLL